ncbi:hypothetical protein BZG02_07955 [Labilibaculum filiforme]|uniref:Thioredoxin domain-containing protein n=1 Tax=Labilibaculum filiforme TaxID=1940526 RepID=A0A2N3I0T3_9BACT|nr:TlpA disulfide reductase family protein [Labilibaculum filiforme]PKQ63936.1 hypothetical protein BZG02_07955 [Labilibaculum filiforme]
MKRNSNIQKLIFFFISLVFLGCTEKQTVNYAIVSGTLINANEDEVKLASIFTSISIDTVPAITHVLKLDGKGSFIDTLYIDGKRVFSLGQAKSQLAFTIKPGQHLQLTSDFLDVQNTTVFTGDASDVNNYLFKKVQIDNRINNIYRDEKGDDVASFIKKQEAYKGEYMQLLASSTGLTDAFISNEKKDIQYTKVRSYIAYAQGYRYINGEDAPEIPSDFFDVVSETNMQDYSEFKRSVLYQFLLRGYYAYEYTKLVGNIWEADPLEKLKMLSKMITDKSILEELFIMNARYDITRTPNLQAYYDFFNANVSNQVYKDAVRETYDGLMATKPGQKSPEFVNYQNSKGGTTSLSDFRGKYVYIDVWATWCGPCRGEIPYLQKVEEQYHGNENIVFVSLSVDELINLSKWQTFVKEKELGGVQLIADKALDSEFVKKYQIMGIPQFILIGPEGKIVTPDAPRPSNPELINLFNKCGI